MWRSHSLATYLQTLPGYLFGAVGEVSSFVGAFSDPERQAFFNPNNNDVPKRPLYIVTFSASALWADGQVPIYPKHRKAKIYSFHAGSRC